MEITEMNFKINQPHITDCMQHMTNAMEVSFKQFHDKLNHMNCKLEAINWKLNRLKNTSRSTTLDELNNHDMEVEEASSAFLCNTNDATRIYVIKEANILDNAIVELDSDVCIWNIGTLEDKLKAVQFECQSQPFKLKGEDFAIVAHLTGSEQNVHISLQFKDIHGTNQPIARESFTQVTYMLNSSDVNIIKSPHCFFKELLQYDSHLFFGVLVSYEQLRMIIDVENGVQIRIQFHLQNAPVNFDFDEGEVQWTVDHFQKRRKKATELQVPLHESPYFYTSPEGYRVKIRLSIESNNRLSATVMFVAGKNDENLQNEFSHKTIITLTNAQTSKKKIKSICQKMANVYNIKIDRCSTMESLIDNDSLNINAKIIPL
ncbi:hypothetical protein CHUAL_014063 [Chamberlinius hualienensis]